MTVGEFFYNHSQESKQRSPLEERFQAESVSLVLGPYLAGFPGPLRMHLKLDGNVIVSARPEAGFLHRGIEKAIEMQSWIASVGYAGRVDPEASFFYELAFCLAAEQLGGVRPSRRATRIRTLVCELTRVASHMGFLARFARASQAETFFHYVSRDREKILDLFELLTGSRFAYNFCRIGGVAADVTDGFIERVSETCELMGYRIREYNDLFSYNHAFLRRSRGLGLMTSEAALKYAVTGPNLRATGEERDLRYTDSLLDYSQLDLEAPIRHGDEVRGDVFSRYLIRVREIQQSIEILRRALESFPEGAHQEKAPTAEGLGAGEAYVRLEGARGQLSCHVVSEEQNKKPARVHFGVPSVATMSSVASVLEGELLEDLSLILASVDLSISEVDR